MTQPRWRPGPTGGLLRDLGSHLVDQMLLLLGPATSVDAQLDFVDLPAGKTDASFTLTLRHATWHALTHLGQ